MRCETPASPFYRVPPALKPVTNYSLLIGPAPLLGDLCVRGLQTCKKPLHGSFPLWTCFAPLIILAALLTGFSFTTAPFLRHGNKKDMDYAKHGQ